jgi:hypothetical protein
MATPEFRDLEATLHAIFLKLGTRIKNGTLSLPLNILITDGDDDLVAEVERKTAWPRRVYCATQTLRPRLGTM